MSPRGSRARASGPAGTLRHDVSLLTDDDLYLYNEGSHFRLYEKLGAHQMTVDGVDGTYFAVWAPEAKSVGVVGDFNNWGKDSHPLRSRGESGLWEGFVEGVGNGTVYKYHIASQHERYTVDKADPFAVYSETPPKTASVVWNLDYPWADGEWMANRKGRTGLHAPIAVYEVHLGSWLSPEADGLRTYRDMAPRLADHAAALGFTHVELMPVMEHPHYESWGYQITGFYAPSSRYGAPQDLMYLIDTLHRRGIAVILDWVPFHFPADVHGLSTFDGARLYEREGVHPRWTTHVFDYSRPQVAAFMLSNAFFWLERYHADALRVDAVSSIVYPDYPAERDMPPAEAKARLRRDEAGVSFLRRFNDEVHAAYPDVATIAEDSLAMASVTDPTGEGGLGFDMKWGLGWLHDTLDAYMTAEPRLRPQRHGKLTLPMLDLFGEPFVLSLSHDEVQPGKGTLLGKMPGDEADKFANVRLFLAYMFAYPGKKLLFMGSEFAQKDEWTVDSSLEWAPRKRPLHTGVERLVRDLNRTYRDEPALYEIDFAEGGFVGINCDDATNSTISFLRRSRAGDEIAVVCNFSDRAHDGYRIGVPRAGAWRAILSSDQAEYGGSGRGSTGLVAEAAPADGQPCSLALDLPPLTGVYLKPGERGV